MSTQVCTVLAGILEPKKRGWFNDKSLVNCAVALAFLSAYSSNPKEMEELFSNYDETGDPRITLGIKLGVLMNGNPDIDASKLIRRVEAYLLEQITNRSGLTEIDGKAAVEDAS